MLNLRRRLYVDPEIQFPLILSFILLATIEGIFVGWGFYKMISIAKEWNRPDQAYQFFKILFLTIVPMVVFNFTIGGWLSHKIAGPLLHIRRALAEIARGNLEGEVQLRTGDFLQPAAGELNKTLQTLRRLIYRDYTYAAEVNDLLTECEKWLAKRKDLPASAQNELQKLIVNSKSRLSIINAHFIKGQKDARDAQKSKGDS